MEKTFGRVLITAFLGSMLVSNVAWSWGARGHAMIGRVAARLVSEQNDRSFAKPFESKLEMIGHLSNIPDVLWKNADRKITSRTNPTHFYQVDTIVENQTFDTLPKTIKATVDQLRANCQRSNSLPCYEESTPEALMAKLGSAPWRIQQFTKKMETALGAIKHNPLKHDDIPYIDEALTYAGIVSHFIGDLTQPLHCAYDYDGVALGQRGLHSYFEDAIVNVLPLSTPQLIYDYIITNKPFETIMQTVPLELRKDAFAIALAIALDSNAHLTQLQEMDRDLAIEKKSNDSTNHERHGAKRKPAKEVIDQFQTFTVARLAVAADTLAHIWLYSWENAGSPNLEAYQSLFYALNPPIIDVDYL